MKDAVPILLALCFVLSVPATVGLATGPPVDSQPAVDGDVDGEQNHVASTHGTFISGQAEPVTANGTTNRLVLQGDVYQSYTHSQADLGTTLSIEDQSMRAEYAAFQFEQEFETLESDEQADALETAMADLGSDIDDLEQREQTLVNGHSSDTVSEGELLRGLVTTHNEAKLLQATLEAILTQAADVPGYTPPQETVSQYEAQLQLHTSDVREHVQQTNSGDELAGSALVKTAETGSTVAVLDDDQYVRETVRYDNREREGESQIESVSAALNRIEELYPWTVGTGASDTSSGENTDEQVWSFSLPNGHEHGTLEVNLDGRTNQIYREIQFLEYREIPISDQHEQSDNGLDVQVNRTAGGGPAEVTVTESGSEATVNATVRINDERLGETGLSGSQWVLQPRGEYTLEVEADGQTVAMDIENE